ncbi:hypothetical protein [Actinoallomurus sp. CA-142502]|uniref:hypothetical protein n=1 Tax=Actinoallomurus sp. CA-142502 TaxID=3239885 RepID=UPI003D940254
MSRTPTDFRVRHLERQLAAARAVGDHAWDQGYAEGLRHSRLEIPQAFTDALRYGSAHEHYPVPLLDGQVTIVLARNGTGRPNERTEAAVWEALERVRLDITDQVLAGVRFVQRRELPRQLAVAIWHHHDRAAIVANTTTSRPRLRAALRSQYHGWALLPVIGWTLARRLGRCVTHMLAPATTTTVAVASAAAVTVIATVPPGSLTLAERGADPVVHTDRPSPLAYDPVTHPRARKTTPPQREPAASSAQKHVPAPLPTTAPEDPPEAAAPTDPPTETPTPDPSQTPSTPPDGQQSPPGSSPVASPTPSPVPSEDNADEDRPGGDLAPGEQLGGGDACLLDLLRGQGCDPAR